MAVSQIKIALPSSAEKVWNIVTNLKDRSWRRKNIEIVNKKHFIEYTKSGYATYFNITKTIIEKRWEFDMENDNINGHRVGIFSYDGKNTTINFTEHVTAKNSL